MAAEENFRRLVGKKAGFGEVERVAAREVEIGIRGIREVVSRGIRRIREMGRRIRRIREIGRGIRRIREMGRWIRRIRDMGRRIRGMVGRRATSP